QLQDPCRRQLPELVASAELAEELPHIADQQVGCFHGGEVAAAAELGPVHDVVVAFGGGPDGGGGGGHPHPGRAWGLGRGLGPRCGRLRNRWGPPSRPSRSASTPTRR